MVVEDIMNINGALFILLTNITFQNVYAVVNVIIFTIYSSLTESWRYCNVFFFSLQTFAAEQPMFLREHWNGMYRTDVYIIAKMMAELPFHIGYSFLFSMIPYYPIGFNGEVSRFFIAVAIFVIVANVATSFGNSAVDLFIAIWSFIFTKNWSILTWNPQILTLKNTNLDLALKFG